MTTLIYQTNLLVQEEPAKLNSFERNCPICGRVKKYNTKKSYDKGLKNNTICFSCRTTINNKSKKRNSKLENNPSWKGYKEIPFSWFSKYFLRANRKRTGDITIEYIYDIWISQDKKCALTGIEVDFIKRENGISASIDRIDSSINYEKGNVQIVHKDVNIMKNHFNQDYFIEICKLISKHNET